MPTSHASRPRLCARMPLSIASCTTRSALTGAAAETMPITDSTATRGYRPARYRVRRVRPVLRCRANFFSEQVPERAAAREQVVWAPRLDDHAVVEHDRAVGDLD